MASQNPDTSSPLRVAPIFAVTPHLNPDKEALSSNPQIVAPSKEAPPLESLPNPSEFFKNEEDFPHANTPSTVTEAELCNIRARYQIPDTHRVRIAASHERMYQRPDGWIAVPATFLENGVRFPLHAFLITLLGFVGVGFAQLVPNSYIHILAYIAFCYEIGVPPAVDSFFTLFSVGKSRKKGFKVLSKIAPKPNARIEKRSLMDTPSNNRGWHNKWFFVNGPEISSVPDWTTSDRVSADFGDISEERIREMTRIIEKIPLKEWSFGLLSKQA